MIKNNVKENLFDDEENRISISRCSLDCCHRSF